MTSVFPLQLDPLSPSNSSVSTSSSFSFPSPTSPCEQPPADWVLDAELAPCRESSLAFFALQPCAAGRGSSSVANHSGGLFHPLQYPSPSCSSPPSSTCISSPPPLPSLPSPISLPSSSVVSSTSSAAAAVTAGPVDDAKPSARRAAVTKRPSTAAPVKSRLVSCTFCHTSKVKCSGAQSCTRCVKLGRGHLCAEWKSRVKPHTLLRSKQQGTAEDDSTSLTPDSPIGKRRRLDIDVDLTSPTASPRSSPSPRCDSSSLLLSSTSLTALRTSPVAASDSQLSILPFYSCFPPSSLQPHPPSSDWRSLLSRSLVRGLVHIDRHSKHGPLPHRLLSLIRMSTLLHIDDLTTLGHAHHARSAHPSTPPSYPERCDGTTCGGFCSGMRRVLANNPTLFCFAASPSTPLEDTAINNFPAVVIRRTPHPSHSSFLQRLTAHCDGSAVVREPPGSPFVLPYEVQVNRAWERLFGYSQSEVRAMWVREGWRAPYLLVRRGEWEEVGWRDFVAEQGVGESERGDQRGWEGVVQCVDKWGRPFSCFMVKAFAMDVQQLCHEVQWTFIATKQQRQQ